MTASPVPVPVLHTASPSEERTLLSLKGVSKRFGGVRALENVSFDVQQGTLLGIIGPNGSGKSTLLSLIAGAQRPSSGQIVCNGRRLDRMRSHAIARLGIGRAHQIPRPFGGMTVRQNLLVAAHSIAGHRAQRDDLIRQVLERCDLLDKSERLAGSLGLLDLKRLEVARALCLRPRLLLLDEVAAGLVGHEVQEVTQLIASAHEQGVTILLVEHVQALIQALATRVMSWTRAARSPRARPRRSPGTPGSLPCTWEPRRVRRRLPPVPRFRALPHRTAPVEPCSGSTM